jgi:hypothetical protein
MNIQTVNEIEEVLNLFRQSFDAFYEALKCFKIEEINEVCDWIDHDESEGYQPGSYYEPVFQETIYVPLTNYIDYLPFNPNAEF